MTRGTTGGMPRISRVIPALILMLAALLAWHAATAQAVPKTQTWIGNQPATPDLERSDLSYFNPDGTQATFPGVSGTINLSLDGVPVVTYCVDTTRGLNLGTTTSDVVPLATDTPELRAMLWILLNATPSGPETPEKNTQGAVGQVATWVLLGQLRESEPTDDDDINDAVAALIAQAKAETATPRTLAVTASWTTAPVAAQRRS